MRRRMISSDWSMAADFALGDGLGRQAQRHPARVVFERRAGIDLTQDLFRPRLACRIGNGHLHGVAGDAELLVADPLLAQFGARGLDHCFQPLADQRLGIDVEQQVRGRPGDRARG